MTKRPNRNDPKSAVVKPVKAKANGKALLPCTEEHMASAVGCVYYLRNTGLDEKQVEALIGFANAIHTQSLKDLFSKLGPGPEIVHEMLTQLRAQRARRTDKAKAED